MEIFYQIAWRRDGSRHNCDSVTIAKGNLIAGESELKCQYGCSDTIMSKMSYVCTYFSVEDNWSFGEHQVTHNFNNQSDNDTITIGTVNNALYFTYNWNVSTTFSLIKRSDTGQINSSPQVLPTPPLRLQYGCSYTIPLAVSDPDNDTIKCRWAVGSECGGRCNNLLPGAILDSASCTINYTANYGIGIKPVALMMEDYAPGSLHHPLSSVALQFMILVFYSTLPCQPQFILHPSNVLLYLNNKYNNVTLTCEANKVSSYYWERQNGKIPSTAIGVHTNELTITDVQPKDTGSYRCIAVICKTNCSRSYSNYATIKSKLSVFS